MWRNGVGLIDDIEFELVQWQVLCCVCLGLNSLVLKKMLSQLTHRWRQRKVALSFRFIFMLLMLSVHCRQRHTSHLQFKLLPSNPSPPLHHWFATLSLSLSLSLSLVPLSLLCRFTSPHLTLTEYPTMKNRASRTRFHWCFGSHAPISLLTDPLVDSRSELQSAE